MRIWKSFGLAFLFITACKPTQSEDANASSNDTQVKIENRDAQIPPQKGPLDSLNQVILAEPNNLEAFSERGRLFLRAGNQQNAWLDFQRAFNIDSMYPPLLLPLGDLYMQRNQSRKARNAWTNCATSDPQSIDCRLNLVKLHASVQDYKPALKYVDEIIAIDEYFAPAYLYKGIIIRDSRKDTSLALQYFQKATEVDQEYLEALDLMGVTLASRGDTLARFYYERILAIQPKNADIYYKLGVHYMDLDEINRAIEAYTKATQIDPNHADSFYNLGYIFTTTVKDYREALNYYAQSIKADPERNYKAYFGRGYAYEMLGDVQKAEADYRKTLALLPIHKPAKDGLDRLKQ